MFDDDSRCRNAVATEVKLSVKDINGEGAHGDFNYLIFLSKCLYPVLLCCLLGWLLYVMSKTLSRTCIQYNCQAS